jgi:hypothetical protein
MARRHYLTMNISGKQKQPSEIFTEQLKAKIKTLDNELINIALEMANLGKQLHDKKDELNLTLIKLRKAQNATNKE